MKKIHFCIYTLLFVLFSSPFWGAQLPHFNENKSNSIYSPQDTVVEDVVIIKDSISITDTIPQDSLKPKKDGLDAPVAYLANDSIVFTGSNWGFLYGDSKIDYETMSIQGEKISMNIDSSIVHASFGLDSVGKEFGFPVFTDNGTEYEMKTASYNFKTKKGYMRNVITQEGEGYIVADRTKKNDDNTFFMCDGKYTTCDHHDHPHFYLMLTKAKVRPGKDVITGPAYLVIEDMPLPLAIPFGFFPFSKKYSSGVIMPSYGDDMDRGFNLRNGGYYFAINEHFDLALTGEIYTKGSWGLNAKSNYKKRYKYSGGFDFAYLYTKYGDKDIPNTFSEAKNMSINWTHQQDPKANMYRTLSASVNYATSTFNQNNLDTKYSMAGTENTRSSNVTLTQTFPNSPFTLSANMDIAQRTKDSTISMTLPNLSINMTRIYPFKRKVAVGSEKWFEKIQFSYTGTLKNSIVTKENLLFKSSLSKDWQNAMQHNIPVSATFNVFNYLNITPSFNYKERWYTRKITQQWDAVNKQHVAKDTIHSFNRVYDFNYALSLQTKMYGFYEPVFKIGKVQRIRHVFTPTITFGGNPDFSDPKFGFYERYKYLDANGIEQEYVYSPYSKEIFGAPGSGKQGNISFSFENNLEMKVATDNDSTKIISLIDNLGINFSYNMMADSLKWSNINTNMRLKLSKSLTINVAAEFDPYMYVWDENLQNGRRVDRLRIKEKGVFGRLIRTGYSVSPSINQDTFKKWFGKGKKDNKNNENDNVTDNLTESLDDANLEDKLAGPRQSLFDSKEEVGEYDSDGYLKNEIKWNMTFNYSMTYGNTNEFDRKSNEFKRKFTHNLGVNGSIQPTKNWNLSFYANYDFENNEISYMNCTVSRNLHCWNISASFVPLGPYTSYYVSLRVNSSLLQDLKYEQRNRRTSYDPQWD